MSVKGNVTEFLDNIPKDITLVAISKTKPASMIEEVVEAGVKDIGENYIQEAEEKLTELKEFLDEKKVTRHFTGRIQSNKVRKIVALFDIVETVDRLKIARLIDKEAGAIGKKMPVLIEINSSGESQKGGIAPDELDEFLRECSEFKNIEVRGLMTIGPWTEDEELVRKAFELMKELYDKFSSQYNFSMLSMGMTHDYKIAIENGSTHIRIGTAIFGERNKK